MKLELKHLVPYLPYELRVHYSGLSDDDVSGEFTVIAYHVGNGISLIDDSALEEGDLSESFYVDYDFPIKPILRPLSSMTVEEVEELNELIEDSVKVVVSSGNWVYIESASSDPWDGSPTLSLDSINIINEYLFKNHFDVFNLINNNLAIEKTK